MTYSGCGTGLTAVACDDLAGPWTGVDLSPRMIEHAGAKNLYARLIEGDLTSVLPTLGQAGLVLASDVLCYFGALDEVMGCIHAHLQPRGQAVISLELHDSEGYALRAHARYAHSESYVREVASASGFAITALHHEDLRSELNRPVRGMIVCLQRA